MPVIVEPRYDIADLEADLARVYADYPATDGAGGDQPGLAANACIEAIRSALARDGVFYAGIFNGKPVAGALVTGPADARRIDLIAVRAITRGRGVALRLVDEIARLEQLTGGRRLLVRAGAETGAVLTRLGFESGTPDYSRPLPPAG
ncbi:MAG: acetyl-CoA sensor PanZ family protein [Gammaproteobacteria bacterium]